MTEVANSVDSTPAAQTPDLSALTETNQNAAPSAETLNTGNAASDKQSGQGDQVPWHQDKRWQSWQQEEKRLRQEAEYGGTWQRAFAENPQFAEKVLGIIKELTGGNGQAGQAQNGQQAALHADPVVNELLNKIQNLEQRLGGGEEYLNEHKFEQSVTKYRGVFDQVMKGVDVLPEYQEIFEQNVWRNLVKLDPSLNNTYGFNEEAFRQAVDGEMQRYKKLTNGVISGYTSNKLKSGFPQTQSGGLPHINMPAKNESQEDAEFASQIKALAGG